MDAAPEQPNRLGIGGNNPPLPALISAAAETDDFAALVTEWLNDRYASSEPTVVALLEEARGLLNPIEDDDGKAKVSALIRRLRDEAKRLDAFHEKEKMAYQRGGQAVDQKFFGMIDRLARRDKRNKPGAADVLGQRLTDYDVRKLAQEQERRRAVAAEADRNAREAQEAAEREERERKEAEEAAARARAPARIEEKKQAAADKERAAIAANVQAEVASDKARAAHVDTLAKPADIMRNRGEDGTLTTMATEPYAEIVDRTKLDFALLAPFFTIAEVEKALRGWAKANGYTAQMDGAVIGRRAKSVVR